MNTTEIHMSIERIDKKTRLLVDMVEQATTVR